MEKVPVAIIMISLNEGHNVNAVLDNVEGWAQEIFLVDSYSTDNTVSIALSRGVNVVQRRFSGFGNQWNFALSDLPITAPWTMKLDPDERLTDELKNEIRQAINDNVANGLSVQRQLWFMGKILPVKQQILRLWQTGLCKFTDVLVNEHPEVEGSILSLKGVLEHHDSPDLHHWYDKQNRYSSAEAISAFRDDQLAVKPKLLGIGLERRMWVKKNFSKIPFRFTMLFLYNYIFLGCWKAGKVGFIWAKLRISVYKAREYKLIEMQLTGRELNMENPNVGAPDKRVRQY